VKICLATPPFTSNIPHEPLNLPMGIAYLASVLEKNGFEVAAFDGSAAGPVTKISDNRFHVGATPEDLARQIIETEPDIIGLSCPFTSRYRLFKETFIALKKLRPDIPIVTGGVHPNLFPERVLRELDVEAIVLGEGESTTLKLMQRFKESGKIDPEGLDGIAWLNGDEFKTNPKTEFEFNLDKIPPPARHLFPMKKYLGRSGGRWAGPHERILSIVTSRSCPSRCTFCCVHASMGKKWRFHSAEYVLNEIEDLVNTYNPTLVGFEDDRFTWDRKRLVAICEGIIDRGIKFKWYTPNGVHVNDLDEELLILMKKSGCKSLNLAIESGDPYILKHVIKKTTKLDKAREISFLCKKIGIKNNGYFIVGVPGDSDKTIQTSLDYCLSLPFDGIGVFIATPFPGTRMFDTCVENGYIEPESYVKEFLEADDPDMLHMPLFETPTMSRERLLEWEKEFNDQFMKGLYKRQPIVRLKAVARKFLNKVKSLK
jgi:phosphonoacetaldehyde methylase